MDDSLLDNDTSTTNPLLNLAGTSPSNVSPLEQEVLDEYSRLLENMNQLSSTLSTLASGPMTTEIADGLRLLERKITSVYTLMRASVYSIVLQQGQMDGESNANNEGDTTIGAAGNGVRGSAGADGESRVE